MELRWKASFSASCMHAAACMSEGLPIVDHGIAAILQPAVDQLVGELRACNLRIAQALPLLVNFSANYENNRQLAEWTLRRLGSSANTTVVSRLAGAIAGLEARWLQEQPQLVEELAVRGRPLREQWEARGPGLLQCVAKLTPEAFLASAAEIVLVSPLVGGHGRAYLPSNRVTFEAVLTHPHPELPETLRLGWLLTQLNLELPRFSETIPQKSLPRLARLATLPLVLSAAESVELAHCNETSLSQAIAYWHVDPPLPDDLPSKLLDWWQAYTASKTRWPVALAALAKMVSGGSGASASGSSTP